MKQCSRLGRVLSPVLGAALLAGMVSLPTFAALGGDAASVDADTAKMKAQVRATAGAGYTISEITLSSGTVVKEYVSSDGRVFAVSWSGMTVPNLQQTLGTYFDEYKAAAGATPHAGHNHLNIRHSDLVVSTGGHMRAWKGAAYLPSLLPPNFSLDDIK